MTGIPLSEITAEELNELFADDEVQIDGPSERILKRVRARMHDYERAAAKTAAVDAERRKAQDALEKIPNFGRF
jgi:hypothetical protein